MATAMESEAILADIMADLVHGWLLGYDANHGCAYLQTLL